MAAGESSSEALLHSPVADEAVSGFIVARWTSGDGLPANEVQDIRETSDGYLWLGTFQGLARFDGVRFETLFSVPQGLRFGSRIDPIEVDSKKRLWFAPDEPGLIYRQGDRFHEVLTNAPTGRVESLCADATNGVWWVDAVGHLGHFDPDKLSDTKTLKERAVAGSRWMRGFDGQLWLVSPRRIQLFNAGQWRSLSVAGSSVLSATPCASGGLWIARDARLRMLTVDGEAKEIGMFPWAGVSRVNCMLEDAQQRLWIGTVGQGLYCYRAGKFQQVIKTASAIRCLFSDGAGSLWVGTRGSGLFRVRDRRFFREGFASGLQNEYVRSLAQDRQGRMWLATAENGLGWFKDGLWHQLGQADDWAGHDVLAIYPSRNGIIVSTAPRGLWRWHDGKLSRVVLGEKAPKASIADLLEDRHGRIWMVTDNSGVFCREAGVVTKYNQAAGLPSNYLRCVAEDEAGDIWAADWQGGLARFHDHKWQTVRAPAGHRDAARAMVVWNGAVWIGTSAGGLLRFSNGKTDRLTTEQGLPDNSLRQLLPDGTNSLWAATPHKLFRLSLLQMNAVFERREPRVDPATYARSEGLFDVSFASWSDPRCWRTADGELWFATANGAIHLKPAELAERKLPLPIIERVSVNGQTIDPTAVQSLRPGLNVLKFAFTAPCLTAPEQVRFRYKLTEVNSDWVDAGADRSATYAGLPPGQHEFHLVASSPDGVWGSEAPTVLISVNPFFWQTRWFLIVVVAVLAGGTAWLIRRTTVRRLRRGLDDLQRQHEMERERARIARDIHDELGANLTSIGLLADIGQRHKLDPSAVAGDLDQISKAARESVVAMDAIVWAINPRNDSVDHFANYVGQFVREFFGRTKIRTRLDLPPELPLAPLPAETRHQLFLALKEAFNNIARHSGATEVQLQLACDDSVLRICIQDDGKGMPEGSNGVAGNGIRNMRERIERLGGTLKIVSSPGRGTKLEFTLPLPKPALN
jgi:signal transduction histidine kinase/ligand-binding sensor domain-containing protein